MVETILTMVILGGILYILFHKPKKAKIKSTDIYNPGIYENFEATANQFSEDMKMARYIRMEAFSKYKYYMDSKMRGIPIIYIGSCSFSSYTIYDEKTAKYKDVDINEEIDKEYKKLIEQFEPKE